jgi:hypothetical protein
VCTKLRHKNHSLLEVGNFFLIIFFSVLKYTWHILQTNTTLQKLDFNNYLHLEKPIFNLLLQCEIWKLMHKNEKIFYLWSLKYKHWIYNNFMLDFIVTFQEHNKQHIKVTFLSTLS